jgi:uncharacterized Zn finger protein
MNCKKCNEDLSNEEILSEQATHNDELVDIRVICPDCGTVHNTFVDWSNFIVIE